jgi:uncharacterized protein
VGKAWACVAGCGACCYLAPEERIYLQDYLGEDDLTLYHSMVGQDGWCINFDQTTKACRTYETRPWFCRVEPSAFQRMYGVKPAEMDPFCSSCCVEQITDVYGTESDVMRRFDSALKRLESGEGLHVIKPFSHDEGQPSV